VDLVDALTAHLPDDHVIWRHMPSARDLTAADLRDHAQRARDLTAHLPHRAVVAVDATMPAWQLVAAILGVTSHPLAALPTLGASLQNLVSLGVAAHITCSSDGALQLTTASKKFVEAHPDARLILATSGSSGAPRHVMHSASNILYNIDAILSYLPIKSKHKIGLMTPQHYSYGLIGQSMTALRAGACIVEIERGPWIARQLAQLVAGGVDALSAVPTLLWALVDACEALPAPPLSIIASAGAALPLTLIARLRARFPDAALFNQYGMTEAAPRICATRVSGDDHDPRDVGPPIRGVSLRVDGPPGEAGPLLVQTPSLMLGYWQQPEQTAAVIRDGWLCTGDLGKIDARGHLLLAGRADDLVQIGGARVSLVGVADAIAALPGVERCAVEALPDERLGVRLCAFIVAPALDADALSAALRALPPHERPRSIHRLDQLPTTPGGKLDREALRRMERDKT
jgi:acyl-CoA synthetase (AMP-forming)/AMP-acid ligase II